jgi:hypothetical protein
VLVSDGGNLHVNLPQPRFQTKVVSTLFSFGQAFYLKTGITLGPATHRGQSGFVGLVVCFAHLGFAILWGKHSLFCLVEN